MFTCSAAHRPQYILCPVQYATILGAISALCCRGYIIHWTHVMLLHYDDVIKWKTFPRIWPFVRRIHRSPVNSPHKGKWCGALVFSLICAWINGWVNNREAGDLRRHHTHYDVSVMTYISGDASLALWQGNCVITADPIKQSRLYDTHRSISDHNKT